MIPRAAAMAVAALVLTGGAMGASAAIGGPNIPDAVLIAVGLRTEEHESGIDHSQASQTGLENANQRAHQGGNAPDFSACEGLTGRERGECVSGIASSRGEEDLATEDAGTESADAPDFSECDALEGREYGECVSEIAKAHRGNDGETGGSAAAQAQELVDDCSEFEGREFRECVKERARELKSNAPGQAGAPQGQSDLPRGNSGGAGAQGVGNANGNPQ